MSLSHIAQKYTVPDTPNKPYARDFSPNLNRKESNSASLSTISPNDLPKPFVKEPGSPLRNKSFLLEDNPDYLDFLALQKEISNYRIQVKGATSGRIPAEMGTSHMNGSSNLLLGADLQSKAARDFDMEFDVSPSSATSIKHGKSEMLSPESSVLSAGGLSSFFHNLEKGSPHSSMKSLEREKSESETKNPWEDVSHLKLSTHLSGRSNSRRRWAKLSCVMHSLSLFRRPEASMIQNTNAIGKEIDNFSSPKLGVKLTKEQQILNKHNFTEEAFDLFRRVQIFCNCAAVGSPAHVREMKKMVEKDPKKYMLEPNDQLHLLNHKKGGCTPLYIAAKNGNLDVVKFLIESKANYWLKSKPIAKNELIEEIPLHAAAKWGHSSVVEYLINNMEHDKVVINSCLKVASNPVVKALLRDELELKGGRSFLKTICRCWGN